MMAKAKKRTAKKAKKVRKSAAKRSTKARRPVKRTAKRAAAKKRAPARKAKPAARKAPAPKPAAKPATGGMGMPAPRPAPSAGMGMGGIGQPATRFKADHTVVSGDTLTLIALKYYGPGAHDKWRVIYDANKGVIGDNPYLLKPGMVLRIPEV